MRSYFLPVAVIVCTLAALAVSSPAWAEQPWRSSLYPDTWAPGYRDDAGRFLQDFSYAGYHRGERSLPPIDGVSGLVIDATQPPFLADPSGSSDSTLAIREAINAAWKHGGGVVFLPEGTYLAWIDLNPLGIHDDIAFTDNLEKECGVLVDPGRIFGEEGKGFIRINAACPLSRLKKAFVQIKNITV